MEISKLKSLIDNSNKIYIASHINPDGDNLGSINAMYLALKKYKKENIYLIEDDEIPDAHKFLPANKYMVKSKDLENNADLFISLDCADIDRLASAKFLFEGAKNTVSIDHHSTNTRFADLNIVDEASPATGETLYEVLKELNLEIDKDIATSLYSAISSDTGSFKYDSTRKETFLIAAELMDYNINLNEIAVNLYQKRSLGKTKLLLKVMDSLELYEDNKLGIVVLTDEDIKSCNARKSDADGIVEFVRDISTVELAIMLKEKSDCIRFSSRSKSYVDVTKIASKFGGGGHIRAAGATIYSDIKTAKEEVLKYAIEELRK